MCACYRWLAPWQLQRCCRWMAWRVSLPDCNEALPCVLKAILYQRAPELRASVSLLGLLCHSVCTSCLFSEEPWGMHCRNSKLQARWRSSGWGTLKAKRKVCALFAGMPGWQWLFIIEGLLTVVYGVCVKLLLAPKPATAWFLQPAEREWLQQRQDNMHAGAVATSGGRGSTILGEHHD